MDQTTVRVLTVDLQHGDTFSQVAVDFEQSIETVV